MTPVDPSQIPDTLHEPAQDAAQPPVIYHQAGCHHGTEHHPGPCIPARTIKPLAKGDRVTVRGTVWQVAPDCDTTIIELDHGAGLIAVDTHAAHPEAEA